MSYWLMKSEPDCYSIDDLKRNGAEIWEGCRNYTVRNFFRDKFQPGDQAFFYNSNCDPAGIAGIIKIVSGGKTDPTQFDPKSMYFDAKSNPEEPRWLGVDVEFERKFARIVTLKELKEHPILSSMAVCMGGQRLSVMPVTREEWELVLGLSGI